MPGAHLKRGQLLMQQGRFDMAVEQLHQELAEDPDGPQANALLAICHLELERYKPATEHAMEAIALAPDWDYAHYVLARVYSERNRDKEALAAINEALRLDPEDADYCALKSSLYAGRSQWKSMLRWADAGLERDPEHVGCQNLRSMALGKLGESHQRGESLEAALTAAPDDAFTHANQGWMLLEQGAVSEAMDSFSEALRLDPHNEWARDGILASMKAKNPIYRGMLAYFIWMSRFPPRVQGGIVIGGLVGYNVVLRLQEARPQLSPVLLPLILLYLAFVFLSWTAEPLFNLLLFFDRRGRRVLSRQERWAAAALGLVLLLALAALPVVSEASFEGWVPVIAFVSLAIPVSTAGECPRGWPTWAMVGIASTLAALALLNLAASYLWLSAGPEGPAPTRLYWWVFLGSVLSTWVGNFLKAAQVRR